MYISCTPEQVHHRTPFKTKMKMEQKQTITMNTITARILNESCVIFEKDRESLIEGN